MSKSIKPASGTAVRSFFAENPTLVPEGVKFKADGRGVLSPKLAEVFTAQTGLTYVPKFKDEAKVTLMVTKVNVKGVKSTRKVEVPQSEARVLAGDAAGKRGALSKTAIMAASEAYTKA